MSDWKAEAHRAGLKAAAYFVAGYIVGVVATLVVLT